MKNKIIKFLLIFMVFFSLRCILAGAEAPLSFTRDESAASCIESGRYREGIGVLLGIIKKNSEFGDNQAIKDSSFKEHVDTIRSGRYLSVVDDISLIFRLAERIELPEGELRSVLGPYMGDFNEPESFQEFVAAIEYRLTFRQLDAIEALLSRFKRYLHANFGVELTIKKQYGYIYYHSYLMARYLFLNGEYVKSLQYLSLASMFRPEYNGIISCDIINNYEKIGKGDEAKKLIQANLASRRNTSEFAFFYNQYHE